MAGSVLIATGCQSGGERSHASAPEPRPTSRTDQVSEIVFVSDRDSANPGEIWALGRGSAAKNLSGSPFYDGSASVSRDGTRVAFVSDRSGRQQVFVVGLDGRGLRAVFTVPRGSVVGWSPQFSRDGRRVLFFYRGSSGTNAPVIVASVGIHRATIRRLRSPCLYDASFSPSGTRISCEVAPGKIAVFDWRGRRVFSVRGDRSHWLSAGRLAVAWRSSTTILDAHGRLLARLRGSAETVSADGNLLALYVTRGFTVVDLSNYRTLRTITGPRSWGLYWLQFTPDGREVAYDAWDESGRIAAVRGGPIRRLVGCCGLSTWSLDGHYAFPRSAPHGRVAIMEGDRYGRGATEIGRFWSDPRAIMRLSPAGGDRLVLESAVRPHGELWAVRADGGGLRRLTDTGDNLSQPAWAADGSHLAYVSAAGPPSATDGPAFGTPQIVIAGPDGRRRSLLRLGADTSPSWSPDGNWLGVAHQTFDDLVVRGLPPRIDVVRPNGTGRRVLVRAGDSPAWSPDGATIAYAGSDGIHTVSPDGSNDRMVVPLEDGAGAARPLYGWPAVRPRSVAWSPDGHLLAYTTAGGLFLVASDGSGGSRRLAALAASGPSFSPDGSEIAFTAILRTEPTPHFAVFVVGVDGSRLRALVRRWYNASDPAWRPASPARRGMAARTSRGQVTAEAGTAAKAARGCRHR